MPAWLADFCSWLQNTSFSQLLQDFSWIVPLVQTIHILCICAVMSAVFLLNLRLLGVFDRERTVAGAASRWLPIIWWALPVLLMTGSILIIAEPARSLGSPAFQLKMVLLILAIALTLTCQHQARKPSTDDHANRPSLRAPAVVSLILWMGIVFAGRWIAYATGG